MAIKINFDPTHNPELPTLILAKKNGEKFGALRYRNLVIKDCLNNPTEINFTIDKYLDGVKNNFWDEILNFRAIYCKEWDIWFELTMDIDEADSTIKNVACVELSQAELSQIMLYNIEINTETDIEREDYVNPTVLYNKDKPNESLLHRIMGKADHYSIEYVSPTITNIQRTFTFDDMSLYDAFNKIAEEINCLFVFNSGTKSDGKIARGISVYDLESNCLNCGYRGEFTQKCPKCNSENIDEGYGEDTTIFVTADEIAKNIKLSTDTGAVKNCFKLRAGDDLMTATIRNCNPNGTDYIWYLSNTVKEDMSEELKAKIAEYDATYENYRTKYKYEFHPAQVIGNYNSVINTYEKYDSDLSSMPNPIWGYSDLVKEYYNATDFLIYLQSELMPDASLSDTNADFQLALLTTDKLSPVSVTELNNLSLSTANNVVLSMARAIVDLRYEVEIVSSSLSGYTWTGRFSVVNYSDEEDGAAGTTDISIVINDDYENFLKQKLFETLSKNNENMSISGLFDISKSLSEFDSELKKYCLDSLLSFQSICQSCLDILIEQDISASWDSSQDSLYSKVYEPYLLRIKSIEREIDYRETEIFTIQTTREYIEKYIALTHADLDFQNYIGENLWNEFILYRREDKYSNDNYISDGLNNAELIQKASEFISVAEKEIFKSAELQHSISASLNNFLVIDKFQPLIDCFNVGNWIRIRIDDEVYKLRLLSYEIDFDNLENTSVEFSDVFKTIDGYADQESVISNAAKMSSSYSATQRQASLGEQSQATLDAWYLNGINTATTKIINEADDQCQIWDRHGMLFKKFDTIKGDYNPNQMKIINSTIALTTDNWTTTKMAIGLFKYVDPTTQEEKEVYGVNGETIIGNLLLGKNLNITNATGSMMFDENGLTVSNGVNTITINPNETYLFNIKNQEEDLLSFDETDGSLKIVGNIVAKNLKLTNNLDYNKLLYVDSNGLVRGIEIDTELNLSSTNPIQNKIITAEINELKNKTDATNDVVGSLSNSLQKVVFKTDIDAELSIDSENPVQNKVVANAIKSLESDITVQKATNTDIYARINANKNDVAINKTTLGYQKKNLLKQLYPLGHTHSNSAETVTWIFNSDYSISMTVITKLTSGQAFEYSNITLKPGTYIYSVEGYSTPNIVHTQLYVNGAWSANLSAVENTITVTEEAIYSFRLYRNASVTAGITETLFPMLRHADVTDDTFEPYVDDVDTRLNAVETKNSQNTNDISTLKDDVLLQKSAIQENESKITGINIRLTQAEDKVTTNIQNIANNTKSIETLNESVQKNASDIGINANTIAVLNNNVSGLTTGLSATVERVSANENNITGLDIRLTQAEDKVTNNTLKIADNTAEIETARQSISAMETNISNTQTNINQSINQVENEVDVLQSRMDNIVATNDTATEGNSELLDIRVGADGVTYPTAGTSVREQFKNLNNDITYLTGGYIEKEWTLLANTGINSSGSIFSNNSAYMCTKSYFPIADALNNLLVIIPDINTNMFVVYYDANKTFVVRDAIVEDYKFRTEYPFFNLSFYMHASLGAITEEFVRNHVKWYEKKVNITGDNVSCFNKTKKNLFDGNYLTGFKLGGNNPITVQKDSTFSSVALIPVKPNTTYSIIIEDPQIEGGYYYQKYLEISNATITPVNLANVSNTILYANTIYYNKVTVVTTSETATHLLLQTSKAIQPFLQVVEGVQDDFTVSTYEDKTIYRPSENLDVYNKSEVKELVKASNNTPLTKFKKVDTVITITTSKAQYIFKRVTATNINIDTWRLYQGDLIKPDGYYFTMWKDSDAEGAIKIVGEDDFVCGYHGDEIMTSIKVFADGKEIDLDSDYETTVFNEIDIFVESDVYHCNTSTLAGTKAFKRNKMLIFKGNTVRIANYFIALTSLNIDRAAICLFQCYYKDSSNNEILTNYSVNTDYKSYSLSDVTTYPKNSDKMTEAWLETDYANINFKSIKTSGQKYLGGAAVDFVPTQNRLKFYFDTIATGSTTVEEGEELYSEFEFTIS